MKAAEFIYFKYTQSNEFSLFNSSRQIPFMLKFCRYAIEIFDRPGQLFTFLPMSDETNCRKNFFILVSIGIYIRSVQFCEMWFSQVH